MRDLNPRPTACKADALTTAPIAPKRKTQGVYFARTRVQGKLIRKSLKTDSISVAKLRLADLEAEERKRAENQTAVAKGKATFGNALAIFQKRIEGQPNLKPKTQSYYAQRVIALLTIPNSGRPALETLNNQRVLDRTKYFG